MDKVNGFRLVSVILSMLLGLGVTQLLSGFVTVFLSRHKAKVRAVPLVWAASVFVLQLQFWWGVNELEGLVKTWSLRMFVVAILLPLSLFGAAAIMLPKKPVEEETDQGALFERDGRWGLVCLSLYGVLAMIGNSVLFGVSPWSESALMGLQAVLPAAYLSLKTQRAKEVVTLGHFVVVLVAMWRLSPNAY